VAGNAHPTEQMPSFLMNSKKLKDPENVAVSCSKTLLTLAEILNVHQVEKEDVCTVFNRTLSWKFPWS
jgi:hypothetical protein